MKIGIHFKFLHPGSQESVSFGLESLVRETLRLKPSAQSNGCLMQHTCELIRLLLVPSCAFSLARRATQAPQPKYCTCKPRTQVPFVHYASIHVSRVRPSDGQAGPCWELYLRVHEHMNPKIDFQGCMSWRVFKQTRARAIQVWGALFEGLVSCTDFQGPEGC